MVDVVGAEGDGDVSLPAKILGSIQENWSQEQETDLLDRRPHPQEETRDHDQSLVPDDRSFVQSVSCDQSFMKKSFTFETPERSEPCVLENQHLYGLGSTLTIIINEVLH